jgi:hypothetical protein
MHADIAGLYRVMAAQFVMCRVVALHQESRLLIQPGQPGLGMATGLQAA